MTDQNIFRAFPADTKLAGFIFTDLDSYQAEYDHRHALFGTEEYELQAIEGNRIDLELFTKLKISQASLNDWFNEIQHLTNEEKVGLWFLVGCCGNELATALDTLREGLTIYHGTKNELAGLARRQNISPTPNMEPFFQEFRFAGETWVGSSLVY